MFKTEGLSSLCLYFYVELLCTVRRHSAFAECVCVHVRIYRAGHRIKILQPALVNVDSLYNKVLSSFSALACLGARQNIAACGFS